jgi:hypothetical protein
MTDNKAEWNRKQNIKMIAIVFLFMVLATGAYWQIYQNSQVKVVKVENVFADVNGDGLNDIIVEGKVIFNSGGTGAENVNF